MIIEAYFMSAIKGKLKYSKSVRIIVFPFLFSWDSILQTFTFQSGIDKRNMSYFHITEEFEPEQDFNDWGMGWTQLGMRLRFNFLHSFDEIRSE